MTPCLRSCPRSTRSNARLQRAPRTRHSTTASGATHRLFLDALRELGAEPVQSEGQPFDPNQHEAIATAPADDVEPGTVTREVRRGWRFGHELLRPAQVVVAARPEVAEPW